MYVCACTQGAREIRLRWIEFIGRFCINNIERFVYGNGRERDPWKRYTGTSVRKCREIDDSSTKVFFFRKQLYGERGVLRFTRGDSPFYHVHRTRCINLVAHVSDTVYVLGVERDELPWLMTIIDAFDLSRTSNVTPSDYSGTLSRTEHDRRP